MINNYDRLKLELATLLQDHQVKYQLSPTLKDRAQQIIYSTHHSPININTIYSQQPLFQINNNITCSSQHQKVQSKNTKNIFTLNLSQITPQLFPKTIMKYQKIDTLNMLPDRKGSSKQLKKNSNMSKSKLRTLSSKSKEYIGKDIIRYNTESSAPKTKHKVEGTVNKKVSISSLVNNKQNYPSKYFSYCQKDKKGMLKKYSKDDTSPFKNIKITRQPSLSRSRCSNQVNQTEPSRKINSLQKNDKRKLSKINPADSFKKVDDSLNMYEKIKQKQECLIIQKESLQQKIRYYHWLIQTQNTKNHATKIRIQNLNNSISAKVAEEKLSREESKISRKKSQTQMLERKRIESSLQTTNKNISMTLENIQQEKYLIKMYEKVIEELKNQLKIEQNQKVNLIKHLMNLKNHEKMLIQKYIYKQALNDQIFNTFHHTLQNFE